MQVGLDQNTFQVPLKKSPAPNEDIESHYYGARLEDQSLSGGGCEILGEPGPT